MDYIGLNKKLYDRRKELDYSEKEACLRLDISKTKLYLIEHGYVKVKDKELQDRFIRKYKLAEDFFSSDELKYPTPIEGEEKEKKITTLGKIIASWQTRVACLVLLIGFACMAIFGLTLAPKLTKDTSSFFDRSFNEVKEVAREKGNYHPFSDSISASLCLDDYYSIESDNEIPTIYGDVGVWHSGVNFIGTVDKTGNYNDENLTFTFYNGVTTFEDYYLGLGQFVVSFEERIVEGKPRYQFYAFEYNEISGVGEECAHISADFNAKDQTFKYNLVEVINLFSLDLKPTVVNPDSLEYGIFVSVFESLVGDFDKSVETLFDENKALLKVTYKDFDTSLRKGIESYTGYQNMTTGFILWGTVISVFFLAFLAYSFIKAGIYKFREKVLKEDIESENVSFDEEVVVSKKTKPLPKNKWPTPCIPELVIRILVLLVSLMSSLGVFYIFQAIQQANPLAIIDSIAFKAEIASFATIAMMLLFFTKLDIQQSKKNTFFVNYVLFFLGLIFYFVLLLIQFTLSNSNTSVAEVGKEALSYLPGNIVWGILAFNLLSSILFSAPKFNDHEKVKTVLYRLLIILPLGYMVISSLYQVGAKAWGWKWPFAVTSLLFNKALILTAFTILYCLTVYFYKVFVKKKYGENAHIYLNGNRYFFIKNLLVCVVIAILGTVDLVLGKNLGANNVIGAGGNTAIFFLIPFVLLYHPHMGKRNAKWDLAFAGLYALSMVLGILMIASQLSVYVTSL